MPDIPSRRDKETPDVGALGRVVPSDGSPGWVIHDPLADEFEPATAWLRYELSCDRSPGTIRTYAHSLLRYLRFLWAVGCPWQEATETETQEFVLWMKHADKFSGAKKEAAPRPARNLVTGKLHQSAGYGRATINGSLSAGWKFYAYHQRGAGPIVVNPFPRRERSPHAHHNPLEPYQARDRDPYRQRAVRRVPRAIPDDKFTELFRRLRCNRDRALMVVYVTSGGRASEVLGADVADLNWGDGLLGVRRKGGAYQEIPIAGHALVWLRLYLMERGNPGPNSPLWVTERQPFRRLSYDACRMVIRRAQDVLGSNWSLHDLRHTFTIRALEEGVNPTYVQEVLGHASLATLSVYSRPSLEDVISAHRGWMAPPTLPEQVPPALVEYAQTDLNILWGPGE